MRSVLIFMRKARVISRPKKLVKLPPQLPAEILKVGVFVNESLEKIIEIAEIAKLDAAPASRRRIAGIRARTKTKTNLRNHQSLSRFGKFQARRRFEI